MMHVIVKYICRYILSVFSIIRKSIFAFELIRIVFSKKLGYCPLQNPVFPKALVKMSLALFVTKLYRAHKIAFIV